MVTATIAFACGASVMALCVIAELLHHRRCGRVAYLAFGPDRQPRRWVAALVPLRVVALGALAWGLVILLQFDSVQTGSDLVGKRPKRPHHIVIALDVSPSMELKDAGPTGEQTRADRARDVLRSVLDRLDPRTTPVSVIAFYSKARPVVVDTFDAEVVSNILNDLPLETAFSIGKTNLYDAVEVAKKLGKQWRPKTATFVLVSDGDTLPTQELPVLGPSFAESQIIGIGNPHRSMFIDGHGSRQDTRSLEQLAVRIGGNYHNANSKHLPSDRLRGILSSLSGPDRPNWSLHEWAIVTVASSSAVLALLPLLLAVAGSSWNPMRENNQNPTSQ